jgi:hypothetical protein
MNASDVIRMRQAQATLKGYNVNQQKTYGPLTPCGKGCCDAIDCSAGTGFRYAQTQFPNYQLADLVYQGVVFEGCKKPSVLAMATQNPVICPSVVEVTPLKRADSGGAKCTSCPPKCLPSTTYITTQSPIICPTVVLDTPLE